MPIIPESISRHADEAAFLWRLRERALYAPHYSLKDLVKLDGRIEAHLDGLRIAGAEAWDILAQQLLQAEDADLFAASVLAFESSDANHVQKVLELASASLEMTRGVISALGWLPYDQAAPHIAFLLASKHSIQRYMGLSASAVHRKDPGSPLEQALWHGEPALKARALRAVGQLGRAELLQLVQRGLEERDEASRFQATWSMILLGQRDALPVLRAFAAGNGEHADEAASLALRVMPHAEAVAWHRQLATDPDRQRMAVIGAGVLGDPSTIPWLLEKMKSPDLARVAGESFSMMTGVDLSLQDLEGEAPEGFLAGPTDDPEDENVELDPDEGLPWPAPSLIDGWWTQHQAEFHSGTRYFLGQKMGARVLRQALADGRQRQRASAALELSISSPGQPLFPVKARGSEQRQLLSGAIS